MSNLKFEQKLRQRRSAFLFSPLLLASGVAILQQGCSGGASNEQMLAQLPGFGTVIQPITEPSGAPAPGPTILPTPTPSPSGSPTPNPSPSPSASPVPTPTPVACDSEDLKFFGNWSSFSTQKAIFQGMNVTGAIAGRTLQLDGLDQGYNSSRDGSRVDVASDDLSLSWVEIRSGSVAYRSTVKVREGVNVYGSIRKKAAVDFDAAKEKLIDLQFKLLDLPVNGIASSECDARGKNCVLTLFGTHAQVNRFTVKTEQLSGVAKIQIQVPSKATAVVLMAGKDVKLSNIEISAPRETIWTLGTPNGTFTVDFMTLPGTVVLAASTFHMDQALLMGRVIAKEFTSAVCLDDNGCSTVDSSDLPNKICL